MRSLFALALALAVVSAKNDKTKKQDMIEVADGQDPNFMIYAAKNNKNYKDTATFQKREKQWKKSDDLIKSTNKKADEKNDPKALRLAHNWTSDLEDSEYLELLGLAESEEDKAKHASLEKGERKDKSKARKLQTGGMGVDHVALGNMTPVKNQYSCGSCWAFTANSVLEGTIAANYGTTPVHLSEQHLVDCTVDTPENQALWGQSYNLGGCNGGMMNNAWVFQNNQGAMTEASYPYVAVEQACAHDTANLVAERPTGIGQITTTVADIQAKLEERPLAIAVGASNRAFGLYAGGVMDGIFENADGTTEACSTDLDHAVTLVGYELDGTETTSTEVYYEYECYVYYYWYVCGWVAKERTVTVPGGSMWKIQNSWGTGWGDNGFFYAEIQDGLGVCGMNQIVLWVDA